MPERNEPSSRPSVTVVLATRNRPDGARRAINAILPTLGPRDDFVVVDSASDDDRTRQVAHAAGVRVEREDLPGVSRARNRGTAVARGEVVAFTDDDCRPRAGWVDAFARTFVDGRVGFATGSVTGGSAADTRSDGPSVFRWPMLPQDIGSGASMAFRRDALVHVGGFDERMGPGSDGSPAGEDQELFTRVLRAGWEGRFAPDAEVVHDDGRSRMATVRLFLHYGVGCGAIAVLLHGRGERGLARRVLWDRVWTSGVVGGLGQLRQGHEFAALCAFAMTAGTVAGVIRHRGLAPATVSQLPSGR